MKTPCCNYEPAIEGSYPVYYNSLNNVVQCHNCGLVYEPILFKDPTQPTPEHLLPDNQMMIRIVLREPAAGQLRRFVIHEGKASAVLQKYTHVVLKVIHEMFMKHTPQQRRGQYRGMCMSKQIKPPEPDAGGAGNGGFDKS